MIKTGVILQRKPITTKPVMGAATSYKKATLCRMGPAHQRYWFKLLGSVKTHDGRGRILQL